MSETLFKVRVILFKENRTEVEQTLLMKLPRIPAPWEKVRLYGRKWGISEVLTNFDDPKETYHLLLVPEGKV